MGNSDRFRALALATAKKLSADGHMLATAESCTGGWIAKVLTDLPGSSAWFAGGVVSYSNKAKTDLLGVKPATLEREGAVSEAVVCEMAEGARARLRAHRAVAVSGVAGPDGGSRDKPIGTVWIAWAGPRAVCARCHHFEGDREAVRAQAVLAALEGIVGP